MINYFEKRRKKKLRDILKGYDYLKKNNQLNFINNLKRQLSISPFNDENIQNILHQPGKLCVHHLLFYRLVGYNFNSELTAFFGQENRKFSYPLPKKWIKVLVDNGVDVNVLNSRMLWFFFQIKWYLLGLATGILEISYLFKKSKKINAPFVCFENLSKNNFPSKENENNIVGWYLKQPDSKGIKSILHNCHNLNYSFNNYNIQYGSKFMLDGFSLKIKAYARIVLCFITSLFFAQERLLLRERVFEILMKYVTGKYLADSYFFHNSSLHFKPLWTYEAEKKGAKVIMFQYSTNILPFKRRNEKYNLDFKWNYLAWKEYWVWGKTQKQIFENLIQTDAIIINKNPIPFSSIKTDELPSKKILVFLVDPFNKPLFYSLAQNVEYYTDEVCAQFLSCILSETRKLNVEIVLKQKRKNPAISKKHLRFLEKYSKNEGVLLVDPDISPFDLILKSNPQAVISMPFTSTASIAKHYNIPSVYFDPTGLLDNKHYSNNGIDVLQTKEDLRDFLLFSNGVKKH